MPLRQWPVPMQPAEAKRKARQRKPVPGALYGGRPEELGRSQDANAQLVMTSPRPARPAVKQDVVKPSPGGFARLRGEHVLATSD